ncbi:glycerophosphodiester phosphodiesterase [Bdellovibrio bacteriovorus]|uniref:glycerophosphodiester phosphodiesterase n=1 Tax=Bdellovibrio bacteriovorus TaxID=959 RepID=UPI0021CFA886|nr:glycerophosphodiester phosphodiesterase [Bdellovibrio bacteriovorus]UXR64010.1 glycerophosphodiester phosphodiesterase [Bdellovibrio bacteriovorus]
MTKKIAAMGLFTLFAVAGYWHSWEMSQSGDFSSLSAKEPFVVAHRGDEQLFPENSAEAFLSGARAGADYVEMDVRRSSDGVFVIHHDDNTGRSVHCAPGDVAIAKADFSYLRSECLYRDLPAEKGQILTLAETLNLLRETKTGLVLDVKPVIKEHEMADLAEELLRLDPQGECAKGHDPGGTYNCFSNIIIYVNDLTAHDRLWRWSKGLENADVRYRVLGAMKFLKIVHNGSAALKDPAKYLDNDGIAFNMKPTSVEDIQALRKQYPEKILAVWTLGKKEEFDLARELKMDGIITSHLHDYLAK